MRKLIFLLSILASCQKKQDLFEKKLTASTSCWLYERPESIGIEHDTVFLPVAKFYPTNAYRSFLYKNKRLEPMLPPIDGHSDYQRNWEHSAIDSTLKIDERVFKIKNFVGDTIFLSDTDGATHLLVRKALRHSSP